MSAPSTETQEEVMRDGLTPGQPVASAGAGAGAPDGHGKGKPVSPSGAHPFRSDPHDTDNPYCIWCGLPTGNQRHDPLSITFHVPGVPIPQGSKVANRFGGGVRDANAAKLKPWRATVTAAALEARGDMPTMLGPVALDVEFSFPRPKSHYRTGRNADQLRDDAPWLHTTKPDIDKLMRALCDAITDARIWRDDSQVALLTRVVKRYSPTPGMTVVLGRAS